MALDFVRQTSGVRQKHSTVLLGYFVNSREIRRKTILLYVLVMFTA